MHNSTTTRSAHPAPTIPAARRCCCQAIADNATLLDVVGPGGERILLVSVSLQDLAALATYRTPTRSAAVVIVPEWMGGAR